MIAAGGKGSFPPLPSVFCAVTRFPKLMVLLGF